MKSSDVLVIGAGHNGLAAAAMLARSGRKVTVLEAGERAGGLAARVEFAQGFEAPMAPFLYRLSETVISALDLRRHGLSTSGPAPTIALAGETGPIIMEGAFGETLDGCAPGEAAAFRDLRKRLLLQASILKRFDTETPVQPGNAGLGKKAAIARAAIALRMKGTEEFREMLRMALMCVSDVLDEHLSDERLKGLLAFDATLGHRLGPRSPTSLLGLYLRLAGEAERMQGAQLVDSPAGITNAFEASARSAGVIIRFCARVARIDMTPQGTAGVTLESGETLVCDTVVSAISPHDTFGKLVSPRFVDAGFAGEVTRLRFKGNVSKLFLALSEMPASPSIRHPLANARLVHAPSVRYVEESFNAQKYGELPSAPPFECAVEPASSGTHAAIVSVTIANTAHDLKMGWNDARPMLQDAVVSTLEESFPGLRRSIVASTLWAPPDIAERCNVAGGHWHHHDLHADRLYALRPVFGVADYRSPVEGLWLCGAGSHPGGGVCGLAGFNAAREIIAGGGAR
jgi:phytoene dehydrogenase-like protein